MALFIPSKQRIIACKEVTPGTAVTTGGIIGPCSGIQTTTDGSPVEEHAYLGLGVDLFSMTPVARSGSMTFSELLRADALGVYGLFSLLGAGSDTISGSADPYTHTGAVNAALPPTYTFAHDTGNATEFLQMTYGTWASVSIDWSPTSPVTISSTVAGLLPTVVGSAPTIATRTTANRMRTFDAAFTYQSNTPGTLYTGKVVSGNLTFSRGTSPLITSESASATDVVPGPLMLTGSMDIVYRGAAANTPLADWLLWNNQGVTGNKNSILWTPPDGHTISVAWWPMIFNAPVQIADGGDGALHVSCSFTASNDLASANASSPVITAPSSVVVLNKVSTALS